VCGGGGVGWGQPTCLCNAGLSVEFNKNTFSVRDSLLPLHTIGNMYAVVVVYVVCVCVCVCVYIYMCVCGQSGTA